MDWIPLAPLNVTGPAAATLNRRIATQLKLRQQIDTNDPAALEQRVIVNGTPEKCGTLDKAIAEALSRELFIRRDAVAFLKKHNFPFEEEEKGLDAVREQLRTRAKPTVISNPPMYLSNPAAQQ